MPNHSKNTLILATLFVLVVSAPARGSTILPDPLPTAPPVPTTTWFFDQIIFNEPGSPANGYLNGTFESDGVHYTDFNLTYSLDNDPTASILFDATTITLIESIPVSGFSIEAVNPPRQGCDFCRLVFIFNEPLQSGGTGVVGIITGDLFLETRPTPAGTRALSNQAVVQIIPVPPAIYLFGSALGLLGWLRRRSAK